ncbi:MAG: transglycosylase domain-containing protein [Lachnospiraceae bacterium]|nr:transglycosylase domain-containing protein [Lachnospiraceae bacterium]
MNYTKKGVRKKQKALNSKSMKWGRKIALTLFMGALIGVISLGIIGVSAGIGVFKGIIASAPVINSNDVAPVGFSTFVYDNEGNQIDKLVAQNANRIQVTMEQIPQDMADAFVAVEDARFYEHNGIDIKGILRAGFEFIRTGGKATQGASTITQQLLKNTIFTDWVTEDSMIEKIERKFQEQYLALEITKILSKEEILERYMNTINLGQNTLGVQAASLRYFNKNVWELNLSECAVIAGITQNPAKYNPISRPEKNAERRTKVLNDMLEQGYITQAEYDEAMADDVYSRIQEVNIAIGTTKVNSYFIDALADEVYNDLIEEAGYSATAASALLYSGGLRIYSTMDSEIQAICDEEFADPENFAIDTKWYLHYALTTKTADGEYQNYSKEMLQTWYRKNVDKDFNLIFNSHEEAMEAIDMYKKAVMAETDEEIAEDITLVVQPQMSMTIQDQYTGYVVAMVGGRGTKEGSRTLNRATVSTRSPGSTFKVLTTYAPALDSCNMTLATVFNDAPFAYDNGVLVRNWWKGDYRGINNLRTGIEDSMNVLTVKVLTQITPQLGFDYLREFGFSTLNQAKDCYQAMALGGVTGVTNLELNAAYAAIANEGVYIEPKLYTKVLDSDGNVILDNTESYEHRVLKETTAFLLTSAMQDVVTKGTGTAVNFGGMAIAGKTGTASETKDVWFAGYTPYYTATVWGGYDNQNPMDESTTNPEKQLAKKLWRAVMERVHEDLPNQTFVVPGGIVQTQVCSRSGKLPIAGQCDGHIITEYFDEATVPTELCNVHYAGNLCLYTMLVACENCPFSHPGITELPLIEDPSLIDGSTIITENPDGTISTTVPPTTFMCPHDAMFFLQPNAYAILEIQRQELAARGFNFPEITPPY